MCFLIYILMLQGLEGHCRSRREGGVFVTRSVAANLNFDHVDLIRLEIGRVIFSGITNSEIFAIMCFVITV